MVIDLRRVILVNTRKAGINLVGLLSEIILPVILKTISDRKYHTLGSNHRASDESTLGATRVQSAL